MVCNIKISPEVKGWIKLFTTRNYAEASIIKGMLEQNQVAVVILNKQDSSYINFGDIELYVPSHLKEMAQNLLNNALMN